MLWTYVAGTVTVTVTIYCPDYPSAAAKNSKIWKLLIGLVNDIGFLWI